MKKSIVDELIAAKNLAQVLKVFRANYVREIKKTENGKHILNGTSTPPVADPMKFFEEDRQSLERHFFRSYKRGRSLKDIKSCVVNAMGGNHKQWVAVRA